MKRNFFKTPVYRHLAFICEYGISGLFYIFILPYFLHFNRLSIVSSSGFMKRFQRFFLQLISYPGWLHFFKFNLPSTVNDINKKIVEYIFGVSYTICTILTLIRSLLLSS